MRRRSAHFVGLALLVACASSDETATPATPLPAVTLTLPASARDSVAILDSLAAFVGRVDADTLRMDRVRDQIALGAGATGTLTAWRADSIWQRIHLAAGGTGFTTSDTYWLHDGLPVAARLQIDRPGQPPAVEQVWFRTGQLYRWVDGQGRHLSGESQSTKTEVEMLTARVGRILAALPPLVRAESSATK